jgi:hypothetical protein
MCLVAGYGLYLNRTVSDFRKHGFSRTGLGLGDGKIRISKNSTGIAMTVSPIILSLMLFNLTCQEQETPKDATVQILTVTGRGKKP